MRWSQCAPLLSVPEEQTEAPGGDPPGLRLRLARPSEKGRSVPEKKVLGGGGSAGVALPRLLDGRERLFPAGRCTPSLVPPRAFRGLGAQRVAPFVGVITARVGAS